MTTTRIKVVPDDEPNADGEWLTITREQIENLPASRSWGNCEEALSQFCPPGHHIVAMELDK